MPPFSGRENIFVKYFQDRFLRMSVLLGALFNSMMWLLLAYRISTFPAIMPLHYNIYYGIDLYKPWIYIFVMPAVGLVLLIGNILLSLFAFRRDKALSYVLVGSAGFVQLIILIAAFTVVAINQ